MPPYAAERPCNHRQTLRSNAARSHMLRCPVVRASRRWHPHSRGRRRGSGLPGGQIKALLFRQIVDGIVQQALCPQAKSPLPKKQAVHSSRNSGRSR